MVEGVPTSGHETKGRRIWQQRAVLSEPATGVTKAGKAGGSHGEAQPGWPEPRALRGSEVGGTAHCPLLVTRGGGRSACTIDGPSEMAMPAILGLKAAGWATLARSRW